MLERLLELSIYVLGSLIVLILGWALVRNILTQLESIREKKRNLHIKTLLEEGLKTGKRRESAQKMKRLYPVSYLEPLFFEVFETASSEIKENLKVFFELLGIQDYLRTILKESSDVSKREKAVLKLAKIGIVQDIPFLLEVFRDPEEDDRVKKCCTQAIYELSDKLIADEKAIANLGLLIQLLDLPNMQLQEYVASHVAKLPIPIEDIVPHLLRLETENAKEGILMVFRQWNNPEHAPLLYDYVDDPSPIIRQKTITLIGQWQDEKSIVLLLHKLEDPSEAVRLATLKALSHLNQFSIQTQLRRHLQDPSPLVQIRMYFLLAALKDTQSFFDLIEKIQDGHFRKMLTVELLQMGKPELISFLEFLGIDHHLFLTHFDLNKIEDFYDVFVLSAKESQKPHLRQKALHALSLWKNQKGFQIISELSNTDPDPVNRLYAKKLLAKRAA